MIARDQTAGLQRGADHSGLGMDLVPRHETVCWIGGHRHRGANEANARRSISRRNEALDDRRRLHQVVGHERKP